MEFTGRIRKVLPIRSGASQNGEWKALPFVFEYFEHETDRFADSVLLETFDTKVIENLKEGMEVRCGWSHKAKEITKRDGSGTMIINELRLYKIECISMPKPNRDGYPRDGLNARIVDVIPEPEPQPSAQQDAGDDLPF